MKSSPQSLSGLLPFIRPYRIQVACAGLFLLLAAATTLAFPWALRTLIDQGLVAHATPDVLVTQFVELFLVAVALAIFSAARFYTVSWLGEKITADLKNKVYAHVLQQSPTFFETTQSGEVLSRLTSDATLIQTVVGSSLSMGLRNLVMGLGAMVMLVLTNPWLMFQVIGVLAVVVFPSVYLGRRVRRLSRASQDRVADSSAMASEVLNAMSVVQSYNAETREAQRFSASTAQALATSLRRVRARSLLVGFIIMASSAALLWGLYMGTLSVRSGTTTAGELGQAVVYVILLASAFAVLGEVYGDVLRAAGATERLMELLHTRSDVRSPEHPQRAPWPKNGSSLVLHDVNFNYPSRPTQQALNGLSGEVHAGQTIAVVGPSGAGKTTLFRMMTGEQQPDTGTVTLGESVKVAYVGQIRDTLDNNKTVWEEVSGGLDILRIGDYEIASRAYIGRFNFKGQDQQKRVGELSGGERNRLQLAKILQMGANVILLDEPSNDLDIETLRALEDAILVFPGTVMVVSHDRWFLDRIATHILSFENEQPEFYEGNYAEYEAYRLARLGDAAVQKRTKYKKIGG